MRRRDFIATFGGTVVLPFVGHAQQRSRLRLVGVLMDLAADDPEGQARLTSFLQGLQEFGWTNGRNVRIEFRWGAGSAATLRKHAEELSALAPDVILSSGTASLTPLLQTTRAIPIIFTIVTDPVGAGFVESLSKPGGNATGFTPFEYGQSAKWLELLKEIGPAITRAAVIRDAAMASTIGQFAAIQSAAPAQGVEIRPIEARDAHRIDASIEAFARSAPSGGLIVTGSPSTSRHRQTIITSATRHRLPAVYPARHFVADGGLMSYGADYLDQLHQAAGYVDRILKGEQPANLPVQAPTKYELVINLKSAKALGLTVPPSLLARADEVIE
jgi:putative ABC transport system substrate-binding protein